jgi:hypothetical protein
LYVVVHNQSTLPFTLHSGINIPTGFETYISVDREFNNKLDDPYSNCIDKLESKIPYAKKLFGYFQYLNVTYYDQEFCFTLCYQDKLIDKCNCSDIITPSIRDSTFCETDVELSCMDDFDSDFTISDLNEICEFACPQQCSTIEYNLDISSATFPTFSYLKYKQSDSFHGYMFPQDDAELMEFARQGFLKLIVNYDNLYYTSIDESPQISTETLFGNLGGQLGLFIGLSFLSFIELLELLSEFFFIYIDHKKLRKVYQATS